MTAAVTRWPALRRSRTTERDIRCYIVEELVEEQFDGDDPLAAEAVDSLGIERLIAHLEDRFQISFDDSDLVRKNFASVQALAALVRMKQQTAERTRHA